MDTLTFLHVFRSFSLFVSHDNRRRADPAIGIDRCATQCVSILMPAVGLCVSLCCWGFLF